MVCFYYAIMSRTYHFRLMLVLYNLTEWKTRYCIVIHLHMVYYVVYQSENIYNIHI